MKWSGFNVEAVRKEFSKIHDLNSFKAEVGRLGQLIKLQDYLGPNAKKNLILLEKRYNEVLKHLHARQKVIDRELVKARKIVEKTRTDVEKRLASAKRAALTQRNKLAKLIAQQLKATQAKPAGRRPKATATTPRRRRTTVKKT